jgi:uncharacterized RDD family membrane protein YckC
VSSFGLHPDEEDALRSTAASTRPFLEYAGWWSRVGAYLVDMVILLVSLFLVAAIGGAAGRGVAITLVVVWLIAVLLGYWVYFEGSESGQTIGKRALGIRVRDDGGGRASYGQALGRNLVARFIGLIPLIGLVDLLWPLWDNANQCLHDKAASTIVVRAR